MVNVDVKPLDKGAAGTYDIIKSFHEEEEGTEMDDAALVADINTEEQVDWLYAISTLSFVDQTMQNDLRQQANAFMGVAKDTTRSAEDVQSTPLPGETLAMFYARSRESDNEVAFLLLLLLMCKFILRRVLDSKSSWEQR